MQETVSRWAEPFFVHSFDVNHLGLSTPVTLLKMMQEAAWRHAESLEFGYGHLREAGLFWVLSRLQIRIVRYPAWGTEFMLETWPSGIHRLLATRDFRITDEHGVAAEATSSWIILDLKNRRPVRPGSIIEKPGRPITGERVLGELAGKVELPTDEEEERWVDSAPFKVRISALDSQAHVNNAKYLEWCLDMFSLDHFDKWEVADATLNFLAETHYGDEVRVRTVEIAEEGTEDTLVTVQAVVDAGDDGAPVFSCRLLWNRRQPD